MKEMPFLRHVKRETIKKTYEAVGFVGNFVGIVRRRPKITGQVVGKPIRDFKSSALMLRINNFARNSSLCNSASDLARELTVENCVRHAQPKSSRREEYFPFRDRQVRTALVAQRPSGGNS